uniref:Uncharacterized protein n=1 Tax=Amblyomma maculatum TaxID=34609 RepID=G3MKA8_AMBMU
MSASRHVMKRIPSIKFPQRHPKPSPSSPSSGTSPVSEQKVGISQFGFISQQKAPSPSANARNYRYSSEVPSPPTNTAVGGKASMLPKRTPLSENEIEAILLGGCF